MNTVLIIGAGNMGSVLARRLLELDFCIPENLCVSDKNTDNLEFFEKKGCPTSLDPADFIPSADLIILAVKPQVLRSLLFRWSSLFSDTVVLCSIAAGVSVSDIVGSSGKQKVIRIMPNTPVSVRQGVCGWYAASSVENNEKSIVQQMLNCFGLAIECQAEDMINAITALSGSGPAYYFFLMEQMQKQAEGFGFSKSHAKEIALHTLRGAGELSFQSHDSFSQLQSNVTSKGGTTEAALDFFQENGLAEVWRSGMKAAYDRAKKL